MGWNPKLIFYACVAKGPTVLAEYTSSAGAGKGSDGLEMVARRCIERTPPNHSNFSHTVRKRSYTFLIDDPFAYFVISHEDLGVGDSLRFLNRVKWAFRGRVVGIEGIGEVIELCFQGEMGDSFRELLGLDGFDGGQEMSSCCSRLRDGEEDKERNGVGRPLLVNPGKVLVKKKKKRFFGCGAEANGDRHIKGVGVGVGGDCGNGVNKSLSNMGENQNVVSGRELSVSMLQKGGNGGGVYLGDGRQKAKQIWRKHVWVVLVLDLVVCAALFGIWLCVCRGFKCIDG